MLQEYIHIQQEETFKFKFDYDKLMMVKQSSKCKRDVQPQSIF